MSTIRLVLLIFLYNIFINLRKHRDPKHDMWQGSQLRQLCYSIDSFLTKTGLYLSRFFSSLLYPKVWGFQSVCPNKVYSYFIKCWMSYVSSYVYYSYILCCLVIDILLFFILIISLCKKQSFLYSSKLLHSMQLLLSCSYLG